MTRKNKKFRSKRKGWFGEKTRHSLAGQGIPTVIDDDTRFDVSKLVAEGRGKSDEEIEDELYDIGHFGRILYSNLTPKEWADAMESVGHTYGPMRKLVTYEWLSGEKVYKDVREHLSEDKRDNCDKDYWKLWGYLIGMSNEQVKKRMGIED